MASAAPDMDPRIKINWSNSAFSNILLCFRNFSFKCQPKDYLRKVKTFVFLLSFSMQV